MKRLSFTGLLLVSLSSAQAGVPHEDVGILKEKVSTYRSLVDTGVRRAQTLQPTLRAVSRELSYVECKAIEKKISDQYPLSPFFAVYETGAAFSQFCDWDPQRPEDGSQRAMEYYFDPVQTTNQMGMPGTYLIKLLRKNGSWPRLTELQFLLDGQYRIVERVVRGIDNFGKTVDWDAISMDAAGNYYYRYARGDSSFVVNMERAFFGSADGTLFGTWVKGPRRADRGNEIIIGQMYEVAKPDWRASALIPTHWMSGRYYSYTPGKWTSRPNTKDSLYEVIIVDSGVEVCADGFSTDMGKVTFYKPSNNQDPWACSNVW